MWTFILAYHNWILGLLTVILWGGVVVWYIWTPMMNRWRSRLEDWAKD